MANSLKKVIEYVGLDYKKEIIKISIINTVIILLLVTLFILLKNVLFLSIGLIFAGGIDYFLFSSYSMRKAKMNKEHADEFVSVISYFRIFINNRNNVYQSFNKIIEYSSDWMKDRIESFLRAIDADKTIKPFTDFADKFEFPIARNVLISIYQMVEQGETPEQLTQFTILFEQMNKALNDERKERKLRSFDIIGFFPLAGAGLTTLSLTFSMLSLVGDMLNVL